MALSSFLYTSFIAVPPGHAVAYQALAVNRRFFGATLSGNLASALFAWLPGEKNITKELNNAAFHFIGYSIWRRLRRAHHAAGL
jgi:hypothetical protein